ncbi:Aspartic proteinase Asp1 [Apostasia shenzhenica]|uniref:Aspartic proteinase Asp1 n=1 Tax=Apostasia shenzhenica TaxID=1088818 RepID=A0A2I0AG17_9ASPA|nr:Aspartic proteinase Asp1 [Apostasia shenzhenica]
MGRRKSRKPESISLAALGLLVAAVLFAGIPSSSADITAGGATSQPKKQRSWPWNEQSPPAKPSSVVFPVYGAVYPLGFYYVAINIGDPPRPYFLDVDTGSDVTWIQCDAPCVRCYQGPHPPYRPAKNRLVPCDDPLCSLVQESTNHKGGCESPSQCDYEVEYADHGSSLGVLVHDAFALRLANSSLARPSLAFGCGYDQQGVPSTNGRVPTDGVLGLGSGKVSVLSQLREIGLCRNVVGHCLGRRGAGYLFFGDEVVPTHGVTWVPMSTDPVNKYYSPGMASIFAGKQQLSAKQLVVFDSGSSYTYFTNQLYQPLLSAVSLFLYLYLIIVLINEIDHRSWMNRYMMMYPRGG